MGRLKGKVALVSGGTKGIGKEIVRHFAAQGAGVAFCGKDRKAGQAFEAEIKEIGRPVSFAPCDVTDEKAVSKWVDRTASMFGGIHVVVANAGGGRLKPWPAEKTDVFDDAIQLNLNGTMYLCRAAWPHLIQSGGGSIIAISSLSAWMGVGRDQLESMGGSQPSLSYQTSKAAVEGLVVHLAGRGGEHNIRVNAIRPGRILTQRLEKLLGTDGIWWSHYRQVQLIKRHGRSEDVAHAAVFLASDESSFITGTFLNVNGGAAVKL